MTNTDAVREKAIRTITDAANRSELEVHNAVIDLRRNAERGDEEMLWPLLDYDDDMVVAATLFALFHVFGQKSDLKDLIFKLAAEGDPRDIGIMPIQCEALRILASLAKSDTNALATLRQVAENTSAADTTKECAWRELAELHGLEWSDKYSGSLIGDPESAESERIRERIRAAIRDKKSDA